MIMLLRHKVVIKHHTQLPAVRVDLVTVPPVDNSTFWSRVERNLTEVLNDIVMDVMINVVAEMEGVM